MNIPAGLADHLEVLEKLFHPVIAYDSQGAILWCNPSVQSSLGYTPDDLAGVKIHTLVEESNPVDPEDFFTPGRTRTLYLLLKKGASLEAVGSRIGYMLANLHSIKANADILAFGAGLFAAVFELLPHRLSTYDVISQTDLHALLDAEYRIIEYGNSFYEKLSPSLGKATYFMKPVSGFLEKGSLEKYAAEREKTRTYLKKQVRENKHDWAEALEEDFDARARGRWEFDKAGQWRVENKALRGRSPMLFSHAILREPFPAHQQDLRLEFRVRCAQRVQFSCILCGLLKVPGGSPDGSGYLMGVRPGENSGASVILKKAGTLLFSRPFPPLETGKWHNCSVEKTGGRLAVYLEGKPAAEYYDLDPVNNPRLSAVGLCCGSDTEFKEFRVFRRPSGLEWTKIFPGLLDVRLKDHPDEIYELSILHRIHDGRAVNVLRLHDVTRLREMQAALSQAEEKHDLLLFKHLALQRQIESDRFKMTGDSPALRKVQALISSVADTDAHVLITGETGTGKDLVAGAIHERSKRRDWPFVKVDCSALPTPLLESELFGHEKGAFTGAVERKIGRFEAAGEGTVFLDEIGNLDPAVQAKLLRVLQDKKFERVGGTKSIAARARILSATNADLESLISQGRFREDLYYRVNVINIHLPPLRERAGDVPALINHWMREICARNDKPVPDIDPKAMERLSGYSWPGNIRELKNTAEYLALVGPESGIREADLPPAITKGRHASRLPPSRTAAGRVLPKHLTKAELSDTIRETEGNLSAAARHLGIGRESLYRVMRKHGVGKY